MQKKWRLSVSMPEDMENAITEMRRTNLKYSRLSYGEIIRRMIVKGLEAEKND